MKLKHASMFLMSRAVNSLKPPATDDPNPSMTFEELEELFPHIPRRDLEFLMSTTLKQGSPSSYEELRSIYPGIQEDEMESPDLFPRVSREDFRYLSDMKKEDTP